MIQKNIFTLLFVFCFCDIFGQNPKEQLKTCEQDKTLLNQKVVSLEDSISSISKNIVSQKIQIDSLSKDLNSQKELDHFSKIGDQYWMNSNLDVTSLNDGTKLIWAQSKEDWDSCYIKNIPAYCYHQNDPLKKHGVLYNIHALNSGKLAPEGLLVPTKQDVDSLISSFGTLQSSASLILKSKEKNSWENPGLDLFNMNINPDGFRLNDGHDWYFGDKVYFFCETKEKENLTFYILSDFTDKVYFLIKNKSTENVNYGMYVRCLKIME